MPRGGSHRTFALATAIALCLLVIGAWTWLKQQHPAREQTQLAEKFVGLLKSHRIAEAYELTMKTRMDLPTNEDFAVFAPRQICGTFKMVEVFPYQSNGNRLRRLMSGHEVEMPEMNVQYQGDCAFRVTMRRDTEYKWKVFKFGSHAQ